MVSSPRLAKIARWPPSNYNSSSRRDPKFTRLIVPPNRIFFLFWHPIKLINHAKLMYLYQSVNTFLPSFGLLRVSIRQSGNNQMGPIALSLQSTQSSEFANLFHNHRVQSRTSTLHKPLSGHLANSPTLTSNSPIDEIGSQGFNSLNDEKHSHVRTCHPS